MGEYFVPTKSCPSSSSYELHEFKSNKNKNSESVKRDNTRENVEEIVMKKARFEVYKFAQSGKPIAEQQKSQFDLALKLGAVPRKNKVINYKKLKEEKQAQKKAEIDGMTLLEKNIKPKKRTKTKNPKGKLRRKRKVGAGILKSYGQVRRK